MKPKRRAKPFSKSWLNDPQAEDELQSLLEIVACG